MHPLTPDLSKLTDEELHTKRSELSNRMVFAYRMGHAEMIGQIQLIMGDYDMEVQRRNQQFPTKLPGKFALLAAAYGTGKDDYLAVVLGIDADAGKLVTWTANFDFGPMADDRVPCGSGHYFDYRDSENDGAAEETIGRQGWSIDSVARAKRDKTLERAWADFFVRSTSLLRNSVHWVKVKS